MTDSWYRESVANINSKNKYLNNGDVFHALNSVVQQFNNEDLQLFLILKKNFHQSRITYQSPLNSMRGYKVTEEIIWTWK